MFPKRGCWLKRGHKGGGSELYGYLCLPGYVKTDGLASIVADIKFSVGVGGWGPTGTEQGMMTAQFLKLVSGVLSQNDVSRIRQYENFVSYGNGIAQVAGHIVFPMRFSGFEIDRY